MLYLLTQHIPLKCTAAHYIVAAFWLPLFHITLPSCLSLPAYRHLSQFPLFLCTPNCTWSWTCGTLRATCDCGMDIRAPPIMKSTVRYLSLGRQHFLRSPKQLLWLSQVLQCCRSQLHTLLCLPIKIPVVATIFFLLCTWGHHPCMVWLP